MKISETNIPEVCVVEPDLFKDDRGYFLETYNKSKLPKMYKHIDFVQDNEAESSKGVLRGLHYQLAPFAQSKLVRVIKGEVIDVAVDIRKGSPTFGKHVKVKLTGENKKQLFIPRGFAHGYVVLSDSAIFAYKCDNFYNSKSDRGILYNDLDLGIDWELLEKDIILSKKDKEQPLWKEAVDLFDYNINLYE